MYSSGHSSGLGFAAPTSVSSLTDYLPDVSQWDWHEWALVAIGGYVAVKWIAGGVSRNVVRPLQQSRRKSAQRSKKKASLQKQLAAL